MTQFFIEISVFLRGRGKEFWNELSIYWIIIRNLKPIGNIRLRNDFRHREKGPRFLIIFRRAAGKWQGDEAVE